MGKPLIESMAPAASRAGMPRWRVALGLAGLVLAGGLFAYLKPQQYLKPALDGIAGLGAWAPVLFVLLYVVACVLFLPGSVLTLGAGAVFGIARGICFSSLAATLGAAAAFLVGRHLARSAVEKRISGNPAFRSIDDAVAREGWRIVILTRLSPVFPFNLLNYAFGITRVTFREYVLASWLGMLPGTVLYVYLGAVAGELAASSGAGPRAKTPGEWLLLGIGLAATLAVTVVITRMARRALKERLKPVSS